MIFNLNLTWDDWHPICLGKVRDPTGRPEVVSAKLIQKAWARFCADMLDCDAEFPQYLRDKYGFDIINELVVDITLE